MDGIRDESSGPGGKRRPDHKLRVKAEPSANRQPVAPLRGRRRAGRKPILKNLARALSLVLVAGWLTSSTGMAQSPAPASPMPVVNPAANPSPATGVPASPAPAGVDAATARLAAHLQKSLGLEAEPATRLGQVIMAWYRKVSRPHIQEYRRKIADIYTPEQRALLQRWMAERKSQGAKAPRHRVSELNLTEAQAARLSATRSEAEKTMQADRDILQAEIKPLVTPAVRVRLQKFMRQHDRQAWRLGGSTMMGSEAADSNVPPDAEPAPQASPVDVPTP